MKKFFKRTWAEVNLQNLIKNLDIIKGITSKNTKIMAVIKADAYGHGSAYVAKTLAQNGVKSFAVSNLEEAIALRNSEIDDEILVLGPTPVEYHKTLAEFGIVQAVHSLEYANELNTVAEQKIEVHIKLDTGMSRLGFVSSAGYAEIARELISMKNLNPSGIFSHLSHADGKDSDAVAHTEKQVQCFDKAVAEFKDVFPNLKTHIQNSAGIVNLPQLEYDYVRPGIVLYGIDPANSEQNEPKFHPVMALKTCVSMVKELKQGTPVGYSRNFIAPHDMKIATVPIGYADGYLRTLSSGGKMLVHGKFASIIGNVCMDQLMLDVTGIDNVKEGDAVTAFGADGDEELTAEALADIAGTIGYEIVCLVNKRVQRVYIDGEKCVAIHDEII